MPISEAVANRTMAGDGADQKDRERDLEMASGIGQEAQGKQ